jgi:hypothetical protein
MRLSLGPPLVALFLLLAGLLGAVLSWPKPQGTPEETRGIEGHVLDSDGPVAGARVRFKGTASAAQTNARGRFHFANLPNNRRVTAWKEGYFIGGTTIESPLTIRLARLPGEDNTDYEWVDPEPNPAEIHNCGNCHAEIYREWSHSGHSRSANGRHFRNL